MVHFLHDMASAIIASALTATVTVTASAVAAATASGNASTKVTPQGGVFEGVNPAAYSASSPIQLLIVQVCCGHICVFHSDMSEIVGQII